jgi:hypothetical protein
MVLHCPNLRKVITDVAARKNPLFPFFLAGRYVHESEKWCPSSMPCAFPVPAFFSQPDGMMYALRPDVDLAFQTSQKL